MFASVRNDICIPRVFAGGAAVFEMSNHTVRGRLIGQVKLDILQEWARKTGMNTLARLE